MENKSFLKACEIINLNLYGLRVNKVYNSIGSHVFFNFGVDEETVLPNGQTHIMKEWSIWIGNASWRITQNGKYVVGSGDPRNDIELNIQKLLDKQFKSFEFFSFFLDAEFIFEDGYRLTSFFNWLVDDQWTVFLPNRYQIEAIGVECSTQEEIKKVQSISKNFSIKENYRKVDLSLPEASITAFSFDPYGRPTAHFGDVYSIQFEDCMWRFEKDGDYIFGYLDQDDIDFKTELSKLIGKKLLQVDASNSMMDGRFQFEDGYVLKTFTCNHSSPQWLIDSKSAPIFEANIPFAEK